MPARAISYAETQRLLSFLTGWRTLQRHVNELSTDDLLNAIQIETNSMNRPHILERLKGRYRTLKAQEAQIQIDKVTRP